RAGERLAGTLGPDARLAVNAVAERGHDRHDQQRDQHFNQRKAARPAHHGEPPDGSTGGPPLLELSPPLPLLLLPLPSSRLSPPRLSVLLPLFPLLPSNPSPAPCCRPPRPRGVPGSGIWRLPGVAPGVPG